MSEPVDREKVKGDLYEKFTHVMMDHPAFSHVDFGTLFDAAMKAAETACETAKIGVDSPKS